MARTAALQQNPATEGKRLIEEQQAAVEFRILGPLEARAGGVALPLGGAKQRALLALLLLEANRVVASEWLIDVLWEEHPPSTAPNALQVYVSHLRKALDVGRELIVTRPPGYLIVLERGELDLERFERLAEEGEQALAGGDFASAADSLRAALDLWRGAPLADLGYEACLRTAILRLEEIRIAVLERRIEADLALGRHAGLIAELEQLAAEHPFREGLHGQLMLALYRSGRQAEALAAYQAARSTLSNELGLEPSPALRRLEQGILAHDPKLELAPTTADTPSEPEAEPERALLLVAPEPERLPGLLALGQALASRPPRELILARPLPADGDLAEASSQLNEQRAALLANGISSRTAAFVSDDPGGDVIRLAARLDVDLVLLEAPPELLTEGKLSGVLQQVVADAPCDVAVLCSRELADTTGSVLVPFGGGEHEWAAVEIGAWIARAESRPLTLAGAAARKDRRDASRILADASLAVQYALGVATQPVLVTSGAEGLLESTGNASLLVLGLPDRWRQEGIGDTRLRLVKDSPAPVLLVRRGLRPSGLAPRKSLTRYTWSLGSPARA